MIPIKKSRAIPKKLQVEGLAAAALLKSEFEADPDAYRSRPGISGRKVKKLAFDASIYGDPEVKKQLAKDQHEKCCYCEAKILDNSFADVEHTRPKGGYVKLGERSMTYPGYFWLAYDWEHLLLSCEVCNRRYKRNHFPLSDESTRATDHLSTNMVAQEVTLLLNPLSATEDPCDHLTFHKEVAIPRNGSLNGEYSIRYFGLNRMIETRKEHLDVLKVLNLFWDVDEIDDAALASMAQSFYNMPVAQLRETIIAAKSVLSRAASPKGKFAACVRANFPHLPQV